MRPSTNSRRLPAIAGDRPNRDYLRIAFYRLPLLTAFFFICSALQAQVPKAIITGPRESRPGALVVLDASESQGTGRLWLLAVSPEETSFLPVESGLKCIFASPTPGRYVFVLVVSGTNANGGAAADMATHAVTLAGATPPTPPDPPTDPTDPTKPPPSLKATAAVYVWEKDQAQVPRGVAQALQAINAGGSVVATEFERDTVNGTGQTPAQYRAALDAAIKVGIPCLVVLAGDRVIRTVKAPTTVDQVQEAVK